MASRIKTMARNAIKQNRSEIERGFISEDTLCNWFNISKPDITNMDFQQARKAITKFGFEKLAAYSAMNDLLRHRGKVITQSKNHYVVKSEDALAPVISSQLKRINTLQTNICTLKTAMKGS